MCSLSFPKDSLLNYLLFALLFTVFVSHWLWRVLPLTWLFLLHTSAFSLRQCLSCFHQNISSEILQGHYRMPGYNFPFKKKIPLKMYAPESKASVCLNVFHVISLRTFKHFFSLQSPFLKFQKLFFIHNCPFTLSILSLRVAFHISSNLDSYVQSLCSAAPQEWDWCPSSLLSATPGT